MYLGGKKAAVLGVKVADTSKPTKQVEHRDLAGSKGFNIKRYRHYKFTEIIALDGDIRRSNRDEEKRKAKNTTLLQNAIQEASYKSDPGPLNRAISDYGADKQLQYALKALAVLQSITKPSVYTLSGIVNACVRCGDLASAVSYVDNSQKNWSITPNEVVLTALIKGLCNAGQQEQAFNVLTTMGEKYGSTPNDRMASTLLRGCMRNTEGPGTKKLIKTLKGFDIDIKKNPWALEYTVKALSSSGLINEAAKYLITGSVNQAGCVSVATACILVGNHELARAALEAAKNSASSSSESKGFVSDMGKRQQSALMFNQLRDREIETEVSKVEDVLSEVVRLAALPTGFHSYKDDKMVIVIDPPAEGDVSEKKLIDVKNRFENPNLPLKVEVCMGHGEWVVGRAASEQNEANWIGIEIRPDRVYQAWSKRRLKGVKEEPKNLVLVCADAREAVNQLSGVSELFINYPEPPGWMSSKSNLLDTAFFESVHRCLIIGGAVTMMSDHGLYSAHTAHRLASLGRKGLFYSALTPCDGLPLSTDVPSNYGSSYFDRMWTNGKRSKRYFIQYIKPTDTVSKNLTWLDTGADDLPHDDDNVSVRVNVVFV
eukprot:TRINITY_DN18447_c0_g1_i2.p1 TRINITY_DN18447_c0_g1~~TRINITY_DN18447_c0_g1_i2.p1  ORF type:complete len:600 (+),score=105.85 TRINITY_DN18447_c0_g1_i2:139-1938(+)